jgi:hypothetical protein
MTNDYRNGYQDGLAWIRAVVALMAATSRSAASQNAVHRVELDAAAAMADEVGRQIDEHVADFLKLAKGRVN